MGVGTPSSLTGAGAEGKADVILITLIRKSTANPSILYRGPGICYHDKTLGI